MNVTKEVYESREDMRNALKRIEAENKAIKELDLTHRKLLKDHIEINELLMVENKALKKSRDELLKWLKSWREGFGALFGNHKNCFDDVDIVIRKAEA